MTGSPRLFHVGTVAKPHGVRGEVKVIPELDDPESLEEVDVLFVGTSQESARPLTVERVRYQHSSKGLTLLVKFGGYDSPEEVSALRRNAVFVTEQELPIADDEVLAEDLVGFAVVTPEGADLGTVTDVLDMPAHLVYEVTAKDGRVTLVPSVAEFVKKIDEEARRITIVPIEGLFE